MWRCPKISRDIRAPGRQSWIPARGRAEILVAGGAVWNPWWHSKQRDSENRDTLGNLWAMFPSMTQTIAAPYFPFRVLVSDGLNQILSFKGAVNDCEEPSCSGQENNKHKTRLIMWRGLSPSRPQRSNMGHSYAIAEGHPPCGHGRLHSLRVCTHVSKSRIAGCISVTTALSH